MDCIKEGDGAMVIDPEECVECAVCLRNAKCPTSAFEDTELTMPRCVRKAFSDPFGKHENTQYKHTGRGTEEIKTNDVTGVVHSLGQVEVVVEMGRPGVGARFSDVEKITKAVSAFDIVFDPHNPVSEHITDKKNGAVDERVLNEKVLSCIIEFSARIEDLRAILGTVRDVGKGLDTVFSLSVICKVDDSNHTAVEDQIAASFIPRASSKINVGLGRPLYEDRVSEAVQNEANDGGKR
jgi:hypothetical protein